VNEAHNDYAQLLVETGLLGFGLMLWFLVRLY
jgi:O-antigen ligase